MSAHASSDVDHVVFLMGPALEPVGSAIKLLSQFRIVLVVIFTAAVLGLASTQYSV